jgi:hypothetical protein
LKAAEKEERSIDEDINENIRGKNMKLSVETKLAAAVAVAFMALTPGVMAQGRSKGQTGGPNHYGSTNNPRVSTQMNQQADSNTLFGRTNAAENKPSVSDERVTSSERQQREERHDAREQREDRHDAREQRQDRQQAHRQTAERYQNKSTSGKGLFDGSILEVKPADVSR